MAVPEPDDAAPDDAEPTPDPGRARRTAGRLLWTCAALSALVGVFLLADATRSHADYGVPAWIGMAVTALSTLALIGVYVACALGRVTLNRRVIGKLTLFQLSTVPVLLAIVADVVIPGRNLGGLALLLPWGLSYWLQGLSPDS